MQPWYLIYGYIYPRIAYVCCIEYSLKILSHMCRGFYSIKRGNVHAIQVVSWMKPLTFTVFER